MKELTSRDRILRMYEHKEADRVPVVDYPWAGTIARWQREGMPADMDWRDYFGADKVETIGVDISPRYEEKIIEKTDSYTIATSGWGVTMKNFNVPDSTPQFLDFKVAGPKEWEEAKARMKPDRDRIDWKWIGDNFRKWQQDGRWIEAGFWFGFDVAHSWMAGTENFLIALMEEPEWVKDVFATYLDSCISHFEMIWDAGYRFDSITWPDDMGYKGTPFFSVEMYRELLKPFHKRAVDWAHDRGIKARLHSCGYVMPLIDEILDTGIDALNPIEVKAGMDPVKIKKFYGDRLVLHGGVNAVLWDDKEKILEEINRVVPVLKENGGYIFSSDHSIPNSVSLENMKEIIAGVKEAGKY
ncbi:MAG: uroporphyrinogen decarboxylase family protein [Saccharofermentanales bacterium]